MTAPDKPGLSNEEGKPTPGQIGGEEALEFQDAQTLAAYWVMSNSENRRKMWESDLKKICEALLSVSGQGQEERALKEQLVSALEEMRHVVCYYRSLVLDRSPYFRNEIALDKTTKAIANTDRALASADKAQDGKGEHHEKES